MTDLNRSRKILPRSTLRPKTTARPPAWSSSFRPTRWLPMCTARRPSRCRRLFPANGSSPNGSRPLPTEAGYTGCRAPARPASQGHAGLNQSAVVFRPLEAARAQHVRLEEVLFADVVVITQKLSLHLGAVQRVLVEGVQIFFTGFLYIAGVARVLRTLVAVDIERHVPGLLVGERSGAAQRHVVLHKCRQ